MSRALQSVPETQAPTLVRWHMVALLVSFSFMTWFNRVSMPVAYDEAIKEETRLSEEEAGTVYSAFLLSYLLCMTPGGWFIDRFGPRSALVVMGFGSGLFGALTALAGLAALVSVGVMFLTLLVVRFLMGLFTAPIYPASSRLVSYWMPLRQRAWANGLVQSAAAVGIGCTFPMFGALIDLLQWPLAFRITGTFTALLALAWTLYAANQPADHRLVNTAELRLIESERVPTSRSEEEGVWWRLLENRSLVLLTISYAAVGYIEYLFFFWMRYYFKDILHLGTGESRIYGTILYLALAAGMILGGWLSIRLHRAYGHWSGRALVRMLGMAAGASFLMLGLFAQETAWIVTWLALALAAVGMSEAPIWTTAVELGGRLGGTAAGIVNTGGNLGGIFAPILTPFVSHAVMNGFGLSEQAGWQWGISLGAAICLCGAGLLWWVHPQEKQPA